MKKNIDKNGTIFALDIGTRSVVGLLGTWENEKIEVQYEVIEFHKKRAMYDGQIHDIDNVVAIVKKVKEQLEEKAGFRLDEVAIAAAGRALKTHRITVEKEMDGSTEIDRNLLNSIEIEGLQRAQNQLKEQSEEVNNYYCVGHTVVNYYLDDGLITNPAGHKGKKIAVDLLATFLPHIVVDSLYAVMNRVGLEVGYMTLEPIAAIEVAVPENVRLLNIALVDIGAGTSDIAITKDGTVVAYAMTSTAGDEITETLSKAYLLDFDSAEALKCNLWNQEIQKFTDIVGIEYELKTEEILEGIYPSIEIIGKEISDNIVLQNGKQPSAVFLIGGGSLIPNLAEIISQQLKLPKERVSVRGIDKVQNLIYDDSILTGPEGITPVGILVKAMKNKEKNFAEIKVNEKKIKLFQSKKLKVSDALVLAGFNPRDLIPKKGKSITVFINEERKTLTGEYGEAANILINNIKGSLDTEIHSGDAIMVQPAEPGKDASCCISDIIDMQDMIQVNRQKICRYYNILINGRKTDGRKIIKDGDIIEYSKINTIKDLCGYMALDFEKHIIYLKGERTDINTVIDDNEPVLLIEPNTVNNDMIKKNDAAEEYIEVLCNGKPLKIQKKKADILFIDIFNHIDIDMKRNQGKMDIKHNGEKVNYTNVLKDGDEIWIDWKD